MDIASVIGLISGISFIIISILLSLEWDIAGLMAYVDWPSVMCTIGGSIAGTMIGYPLPKIITAFKAFGNIFKLNNTSPKDIIEQVISLANVARKEGILALEEAAQSAEDKFLKKGILLIVDGTDPDLVRSILETELSYIEGRHKDVQSTWEFIGSMGPAWGMIGTLIGLINMLGNLSDPSSLGPQMAVALITTFYGSVLANYICIPVANKLKNNSGEEFLLKEVLIEGMLSIQNGENPRIIEEKLKSFLSPTLRETIGGDAAKGGADGGE